MGGAFHTYVLYERRRLLGILITRLCEKKKTGKSELSHLFLRQKANRFALGGEDRNRLVILGEWKREIVEATVIYPSNLPRRRGLWDHTKTCTRAGVIRCREKNRIFSPRSE